MALIDFRLSQEQRDNSFVVVLADDDDTRVIAKIAREAIDDYFQRRELLHHQRVALVKNNLPQIASMIASKYMAGEHMPYTDVLGLTEENNRLVVIKYAYLLISPA